MNTMTYRGYAGSVEYSREDGILWGRVLGIRHLIDFEGESVAELENDFHRAIDSYLKVCREEGIKPERSCSGKLLLRMPPEVHAGLARIAETTGLSANQLIVDAVRVRYLDEEPNPNPPKPCGKGRRMEIAGERV